MTAPEVTVIDYGVGNLLSVRRALEYCGGRVAVTSDPASVLASRRVVLPGVGAFAHGMTELRRNGLDEVVQEVARGGIPVLGICLGMQMLLDGSEEFGETVGLGLIPGSVVELPAKTREGEPQKIPHIGWGSLVFPEGSTSWAGTPLANVMAGDSVYFVHSFMAGPGNRDHLIANCLYRGVSVTAAVRCERVFGVQFHPEKSGEVGLTILRTFLAL